MLWTFIATVTAGLGAAGIALLIRKLSRDRAPKWVVPAFAGAGMLAFLISGEYGWAELKASQLPKGALVVKEITEPVVWRPWTYFVPQVNQLVVLDTQSVQTHPAHPEQRVMMLYRFEQGIADSVVARQHVLNCATGELLLLGDDGPLLKGMQTLSHDDVLRRAVCD